MVRNRTIRSRSKSAAPPAAVSGLDLVPPVHRATHRIGLFLQAFRPDLEVTQGEAHVLVHLTAGPAPIGALHAAFAHRRSTLTSLLDRLEERGLVTRELRLDDRRSFLVRLTAAGRTRARRVQSALQGLERRVRKRVDAKALAGFQAVIGVLEEEARRET